MEPIEIEGKTVEDAIKRACERLNVSREALKVEIITDGSSRLFGLVGGRKARIRVWLREVNRADKARRVLEEILLRANLPGTVKVTPQEDRILVEIQGDGSGILIGRKGKTLDALEYLINRIVPTSSSDQRRIVVDAEGYRARREQQLREMAAKLAQQAVERGKPALSPPLNARERRIVHLALRDHPQVTTASRGEGELRRVVVSPKPGA